MNLSQFFDSYAQAVYQKDVGQMMELYHEDVTVMDAFDLWVVRGKSAWEEHVRSWFSSLENDLMRVSFRDMTILSDDNLATAYGTVLYERIGETEKPPLDCRVTFFFLKTNQGFKIIHEHTSAPLGYEDGRMMQPGGRRFE